MNAELVIPGIVTLAVAVFSPWLMAHQLNKARHKEKQQDWARQDEVAARVVEAAAEVANRAALLVESNASIAATLEQATTETSQKIDGVAAQAKVIHTLVNSNLTTQMQATMTSLEAQLVLLADGEQTPDRKRVIAGVRAQRDELKADLDDRAKAAETAEAQAKEATT